MPEQILQHHFFYAYTMYGKCLHQIGNMTFVFHSFHSVIVFYLISFMYFFLLICIRSCKLILEFNYTVDSFIFVGINFRGLLKTCIFVDIWFHGFANLCIQSLLKICYSLNIWIPGSPLPMKIGIQWIVMHPQYQL